MKVFAIGAEIVRVDILMLYVLSFSSPNSERRLDMGENTDSNTERNI